MNTHILRKLEEIEDAIKEIRSMISPRNERVDGRHVAGQNEGKRIPYLIEQINTHTNIGKDISKTFKEHTGYDIVSARERTGSNRSTHYDIEIIASNGKTYKIEHKGCNGTKTIKNPCDAGVQLVNGKPEWFNICNLLSYVYYDRFIVTKRLSVALNLQSDIPSPEEFRKDQFRQGNPKSPFLIELKKTIRDKYGSTSSLKDIPELDPRREVIEIFRDELFTSKECERLKKDILTNVAPALNEKDLYLTDQPKSEIPFRFWDAKDYTIQDIQNITLDTTNTDPCFNIEAINQKGDIFYCVLRLRWGKGVGFSNIRADIRIN